MDRIAIEGLEPAPEVARFLPRTKRPWPRDVSRLPCRRVGARPRTLAEARFRTEIVRRAEFRENLIALVATVALVALAILALVGFFGPGQGP